MLDAPSLLLAGSRSPARLLPASKTRARRAGDAFALYDGSSTSYTSLGWYSATRFQVAQRVIRMQDRERRGDVFSKSNTGGSHQPRCCLDSLDLQASEYGETAPQPPDTEERQPDGHQFQSTCHISSPVGSPT